MNLTSIEVAAPVTPRDFQRFNAVGGWRLRAVTENLQFIAMGLVATEGQLLML